MNWRAGIVGTAALMLLALRSSIAFADEAAQQLFLQGRYEQAAEGFAKAADHDPAAVIGLARCRVATGKRKPAFRLLEAACERVDKAAAGRGAVGSLGLG